MTSAERDAHDVWHRVYVEGCDDCIDRARELEERVQQMLHARVVTDHRMPPGVVMVVSTRVEDDAP